MEQIKVLYPFKNSSYQTFLQDMADSLIATGLQKENAINIPWKYRLLIAKLKLSRNFSFLSKNNPCLFVLGAGYIDAFAFPFAYTHNIIPVLWDTWPRYWDRIISSFKRHNIKLAFFTQSSVAQYISSKMSDTACVHLPEGLNPIGYKSGKALSERSIDVLEMGRIFNQFHEKISADLKEYTHLFQKGNQLLFKTFDDLTNGISDAKISICFPRNMTNPQQAGSVETLTQRYWECMFSRSLIYGHAPKELINLLGYNPVIEINWEDPTSQIKNILQNIEKYQCLVDQNLEYAKKYGTWKSRIPFIKSCIDKYL